MAPPGDTRALTNARMTEALQVSLQTIAHETLSRQLIDFTVARKLRGFSLLPVHCAGDAFVRPKYCERERPVRTCAGLTGWIARPQQPHTHVFSDIYHSTVFLTARLSGQSQEGVPAPFTSLLQVSRDTSTDRASTPEQL